MILRTGSIPFCAVLCCLDGRATGFGPDAGGTEHSSICGVEHHGRGGHGLLGGVRHGLDGNELLAVPGVLAVACQSVSVGRQVRPASGKRFYRAVQSEGPTNMVFIAPGTFRLTEEVD